MTLEPAMKLIAMKAPSVTTAITRTVIAGRMLVVVVRGAWTSAVTRSSLSGRSGRGRGRGATRRRRRARPARRPWRRAPRRRRRGPAPRPAAMAAESEQPVPWSLRVSTRAASRTVTRPGRHQRGRARAPRWRRRAREWPPLTTTQRRAQGQQRAAEVGHVVDRGHDATSTPAQQRGLAQVRRDDLGAAGSARRGRRRRRRPPSAGARSRRPGPGRRRGGGAARARRARRRPRPSPAGRACRS